MCVCVCVCVYGELFLLNLDVIGSLDHTFMQINKNNITNQMNKNQPSLF